MTLKGLKEKYPRVTALVMYAVHKGNLTPWRIRCAAEYATSDDLQYDITRVIVGGNPAMAESLREEAELFLEELEP
jgi:hypothetical protein